MKENKYKLSNKDKTKTDKTKTDKTKADKTKSNKSKNKTNQVKSKGFHKSNNFKTSKMEHENNGNINKKEIISKKKDTTLYLFYMTQKDIEARQIYEVLKENDNVVIELWDAMNILQIELPNKNAIDFELIEPDFKNPFDQSFIKNSNIKTIFTVTVGSQDFDMIKPLFKTIIDQYEGFFCTDSDDFKPIYKSENL